MQIAQNAFHSRRQFVRRLAVATPPLAWASHVDSCAAQSQKAASVRASAPCTVRDCFWAWAHDARCYANAYGLPRNGRITPVEGAHYLAVPNIIPEVEIRQRQTDPD